MKNIFIAIILFLGVSTISTAQVDRSKAPKPSKAPKIQIGDYEYFSLPNGLKVYVIENHKLPKVTFNLIVDRNPILEGDAAGYVSAAGSLIERETKNRTKDQLNEEIDFIGASLYVGSTAASISGLKKHSDKLMDLMSDVVLNPSFNPNELEKIKKDMQSELAQSKSNASAIASNVKNALNFGKEHPYGEMITENTIANITLDMCKEYYATYFRPNISYLAIVGDINKAEAQVLVNKYFSKWEAKEIPAFKMKETAMVSERKIAVVDKPGAVQSVINLTYPINLPIGSSDELVLKVANAILGGGGSAKLFKNLREDKGFTYGAYSSVSPDKYIGNFTASASVRTEVTDSAIVEFIKEIDNMIKGNITEQELAGVKSQMIGNFARSLESPETVAKFALNVVRYNLPKDYYTTYLQRLNEITLDQVKEVSKKYFSTDKMNILVVGNSNEVVKKLAQFGEVKKYDVFGNLEKASSVDVANFTAKKVIDNYVSALGGSKALADVKSLSLNYSGKLPQANMDFELITFQKNASKLLITQKVAGNEMSVQVYNGTKGFMKSPMGNKELEGDMLSMMKEKSVIFPETDYEKLGYTLELSGVKKVKENDAFEVSITSPSKQKTTRYFDVSSFLLVKEITAEGQTIYFDEYKAVQGVSFPHSLSVEMPMMSLDLKAKSIEVNKTIEDSVFEMSK